MMESLFYKAEDPEAGNFIKKRLQYKLFSMNFAKLLRTLFFIEHLQATASEI